MQRSHGVYIIDRLEEVDDGGGVELVMGAVRDLLTHKWLFSLETEDLDLIPAA